MRGTTISCVKNLQQQLEKEGFLTFAALAPTVKKGEEDFESVCTAIIHRMKLTS
ncbi:hypothetical protein QW060_25295 [Myroides ceti]|uniref:Uncharacterized protein n=1 Tax=Paenimyroides ceti TaxID=395087 RepID=A0ABT8D1J8_9FLAO|nr:hypothetical protein [Paenimyroides ceti]MDN3710191.1 hypothetical protein [Paenimyroides ceti]